MRFPCSFILWPISSWYPLLTVHFGSYILIDSLKACENIWPIILTSYGTWSGVWCGPVLDTLDVSGGVSTRALNVTSWPEITRTTVCASPHLMSSRSDLQHLKTVSPLQMAELGMLARLQNVTHLEWACYNIQPAWSGILCKGLLIGVCHEM